MAGPRKKRTTVIAAKPYPVGGGTASMVRESAGDTVAQELARRVRTAGAYTVGDQTPPAAILWPDGEQRWAGVLPELKALVPELYSLGAIAPEERTGPAIWLRCIEARTAEPAPPTGRTPIFYLPFKGGRKGGRC